jgi:hypothetical protein
MTERTMRLLLDAAARLGYEDEVSGDAGYSGRGMFGRTTCAVTCPDHRALLACAVEAAFRLADGGATPNERDDFRREVAALRFDDMGRGTVAY